MCVILGHFLNCLFYLNLEPFLNCLRFFNFPPYITSQFTFLNTFLVLLYFCYFILLLTCNSTFILFPSFISTYIFTVLVNYTTFSSFPLSCLLNPYYILFLHTCKLKLKTKSLLFICSCFVA